MSIHPNALLMLHLSPNDLPRKTFLEIVRDAGSDPDDAQVKIDGHDYSVKLMDGDYDEGWQVSGAEGEIVLMSMVTYGYGERISWDDLRTRANALATWAEENMDRYKLASAKVSIGANYW